MMTEITEVKFCIQGLYLEGSKRVRRWLRQRCFRGYHRTRPSQWMAKHDLKMQIELLELNNEAVSGPVHRNIKKIAETMRNELEAVLPNREDK